MIDRARASLAPRVLLALFGALPDDASVAVAEEPLGRRPDQLVAGGLLEGQPTAELAAPLCNHGPALSCSDGWMDDHGVRVKSGCVWEENIRRLVSVQPSTVYVILIQLIQAFLFDFIVYIHNCTPETTAHV